MENGPRRWRKGGLCVLFAWNTFIFVNQWIRSPAHIFLVEAMGAFYLCGMQEMNVVIVTVMWVALSLAFLEYSFVVWNIVNLLKPLPAGFSIITINRWKKYSLITANEFPDQHLVSRWVGYKDSYLAFHLEINYKENVFSQKCIICHKLLVCLFYFYPILFDLKTYIIFHKQTYFKKVICHKYKRIFILFTTFFIVCHYYATYIPLLLPKHCYLLQKWTIL